MLENTKLNLRRDRAGAVHHLYLRLHETKKEKKKDHPPLRFMIIIKSARYDRQAKGRVQRLP